MDQPEGLQFGAVNPPEPVGMPWGLAQTVDISFSTSVQWHSGHAGGGSLEDSTSCSKQWQQALH